MQGAFIQAHTYKSPTILGRQLLPFSPWHGVILEAAASPYILGGIPKLDDMILGVWVCSHSHADGWNAAANAPSAQEWGNSLTDPNFPAALTAFDEYISASFMGPEYWSSGGGSEIRAPYMWHLATFGMSYLHMSEVAAWDCSVAKLMCYHACKAEVEGNKDLVSNEDMRGMEVLKKDEETSRKSK